jgi:DnaJ domain
MPEPVRLDIIIEAYSTSANVYSRPRSLPDSPPRDRVQISREAREKSREFLLKLKEESSSEKPSSERQAENDLEILRLSANATRDQIHKAYLAAIKQYHPDNFGSFCQEFQKLAEEKSKQINLAYKKLAGMRYLNDPLK